MNECCGSILQLNCLSILQAQALPCSGEQLQHFSKTSENPQMERLNTKYPGLQNTQDLFMIISIKIRNQAIIMTVNYLIAIFISNTLF